MPDAVVDHDPDYVVVGEGRTFNLELVEAACKVGTPFGHAQPALPAVIYAGLLGDPALVDELLEHGLGVGP